VTGSSGTIGTRLFEKLMTNQHEATGVDRRRNRWINGLNLDTIKTDLLDKSNLRKLPTNVDMIIHLAANARVYELVKNPSLARENMITTFNILEFARNNDIKRLILASSREVYGNTSRGVPIREDEIDIKTCESPYSASKLSSEALLYAYSKVYGIDFLTIRFSNVYGMYDDSDRVIPLWIKQTLKNENLIVYGRDKILDFTYIDDAVDGIMKAIRNFGKAKNDVYNIASGKEVRLVDVATEIIRLLEGKNRILLKENRPGEVIRFQADISKAKKILNYEPRVNIETGLDRTINWYKRLYSS
jgi:UDP-glucose 4-epimerase